MRAPLALTCGHSAIWLARLQVPCRFRRSSTIVSIRRPVQLSPVEVVASGSFRTPRPRSSSTRPASWTSTTSNVMPAWPRAVHAFVHFQHPSARTPSSERSSLVTRSAVFGQSADASPSADVRRPAHRGAVHYRALVRLVHVFLRASSFSRRRGADKSATLPRLAWPLNRRPDTQDVPPARVWATHGGRSFEDAGGDRRRFRLCRDGCRTRHRAAQLAVLARALVGFVVPQRRLESVTRHPRRRTMGPCFL